MHNNDPGAMSLLAPIWGTESLIAPIPFKHEAKLQDDKKEMDQYTDKKEMIDTYKKEVDQYTDKKEVIIEIEERKVIIEIEAEEAEEAELIVLQIASFYK